MAKSFAGTVRSYIFVKTFKLLIMGKHIGVGISKEGFLAKVKVLESKFEREVGDVMRIDNVEYKVLVAEDTKFLAFEKTNSIIKINNKSIQERNLAEAQVFWNSLGF